ncbi:hypothetical protein HAX54_003294, partial [Datura stramonium]|nr:hypothetical protein [Datura stramonium]
YATTTSSSAACMSRSRRRADWLGFLHRDVLFFLVTIPFDVSPSYEYWSLTAIIISLP